MAACHAISAAMIGIYEDNWPAHPVQARVGVASTQTSASVASGFCARYADPPRRFCSSVLMLFMVFFVSHHGPFYSPLM